MATHFKGPLIIEEDGSSIPAPSITGDLAVSGEVGGATLDISGAAAIGGLSTLDSIDVTNDADVGGALDVVGNADVGGALGVTGEITCVAGINAGLFMSADSIQVGGGSNFSALFQRTPSVVVPAVAAGAESDIAADVTGAAAGDNVIVTIPAAAAEANLGIVAAWVSAADTVTIRVRNFHAANPLTGSTELWRVLIVRN